MALIKELVLSSGTVKPGVFGANIVHISFDQLQDADQAKAPLLNLPVEIMYRILEYLPSFSRLILTRTCRGMQNIVSRHAGGVVPSCSQLKPLARVFYLRDMTNGDHKLYSCPKCVRLHRMDERDVAPGSAAHEPCRWKMVVAQRSSGTGDHNYWLWHRHVQIALKQARLLSEGRLARVSYLRRLMTPYHKRFEAYWQGTFETIFPERPTVMGHYSAFPRIVGGRFILHSVAVYRYSNAKGRHDPREPSSRIEVCEHLDTWLQSGYAAMRRRREQIVQAGGEEPEDSWGLEPKHNLNEALYESIEARGSWSWSLSASMYETWHKGTLGPAVPGSCEKCATDFEVQSSARTVVVRWWSDRGSEESVMAHSFSQAWKQSCNHCEAVREPRSAVEGYGECDAEVMLAMELAEASFAPDAPEETTSSIAAPEFVASPDRWSSLGPWAHCVSHFGSRVLFNEEKS